MDRRYPQAVHDFIRENVSGRTAAELAALTNARFGTDFTQSSMNAYKCNHHLRSGTPTGTPKGAPSKKYPQEIRDYILAHYKNVGPTEMTETLNRAFGTSYTPNQLKAYYANHNLCSNVTGRFEKGHIPFNKGRKGISYPGMEASRFQPGCLPATTKPIGWERVTRDGYTEVKVRMRPSRPDRNDNFVAKHRLIWETAHGPIPDGHIVIFKDGDKTNFDLDNLALVTRSVHRIMNCCGLRSSDPELTNAGITVARVKAAVYEKKRHKREAL